MTSADFCRINQRHPELVTLMTEQALRGYESLAEFAPDWISAPGETVADLLEERGWSQADFATRTGFTQKHVHLLLQGKVPISEGIALKLEQVLGGSARFWMKLETQYREQFLRREVLSIEANVSLKSRLLSRE